jgi:regulatory protein
LAETAYLHGLRQLARRELSEAQLRQRLSRRDFPGDEIEAALTRLRQDGSLDDARVAGAIARSQLALKRRGRLRVRREIEAAGIAPALVERALDEAYADVDVDALLTAAIDRRLGTNSAANGLGDERGVARLFRYLVAQGFEHDRALAALRARRRTPKA